MLLAASSALLWIYGIASINPLNNTFADLYPVLLWRLGEFRPAVGSIQGAFFPAMLTHLPGTLAFLSHAFGLSADAIYSSTNWASLAVGFAAIYATTRTIAQSHWAALFALLVFPGTWLTEYVVGYPVNFVDGQAFAGAWAMEWALGIWAVWLALPREGRKAVVPYVLTGILFNFHSTYAAILIAIFSAHELATVLLRRHGPSAESSSSVFFGIKLLVFFVFGFPQFYSLAIHAGEVRALPSAENWWKLIILRKNFHVFLWDGTWAFESLGRLGALFILLFVATRRHLAPSTSSKLLATAVSVAGFALISYLSVEILPIPTLAALVLTRSVFLVIVMIVALACACLVFSLRRYEQTKDFASAIAPLLAMGVVLSLSFDGRYRFLFTPTLLLLLALVVATDREVREAWRLLLVLAALLLGVAAARQFAFRLEVYLGILIALTVALLPYLTTRREQVPSRAKRLLTDAGAAQVTIWLGVAVVAIVLPYNYARKFDRIAASMQMAIDPKWTEATDWIANHTEPSALFIGPPVPDLSFRVRRSYVIDYDMMGSSIYAANLTGFEIKALKTIYDIDLEHTPRDSVRKIHWRILCALEEKYAQFVSSDDRVKIAKQEYPELSYVIGFVPETKPYQWECTTFRGQPLHSTIAFRNDKYVVYDVRHLQ